MKVQKLNTAHMKHMKSTAFVQHTNMYNSFEYFHFYNLSGELEVASAKNVVLCTTLMNKRRDRDDGIIGLLVVTNFKLSFLTGSTEQVKNEN